ncbi:MAG: HAD-IIA family hydrolase [Candidatus Nanohaloarchaea archaeon]|nr:HAD-IIA family hydrolase [Candidatus Nanohaloarchaea archaeon]
MVHDAAIIDMDGTLYREGTAIDGAAAAVSWLREQGITPLFLTNNASRHRQTYVDRLADCGIDAERDEIITSGYLTARHLADTVPGSTVYVVGEDGLRDEIREQDLSLTAVPDEADVFVLSYTREVDYELLTEMLRGFDDDTLIATNPDQTLPGEDGPLPGTGTIVAACEAMLGEEAEVIGKPSLTAAETATSLVDAEPEGCLMIGDRCNTDIVMGKNAGMTTVLVLTGVTDRQEATATAVEPDFVLDSIADLRDALDQNS